MALRKLLEKELEFVSESAAGSASEADMDTLHSMIAEAAYYRAEKRGFEPGHELADWFEAESDIKQRGFSSSASILD